MNGEDLIIGLGCIDEAYVEEAETGVLSGPAYGRWIALAACAGLIVLGASVLLREQPVRHSGVQSLQDVESPAITVTESPAETDCILSYSKGELYWAEIQVSGWTDTGFTGTVTRIDGTADLAVGDTVTVVLEESGAQDTDQEMCQNALADDSLSRNEMKDVEQIVEITFYAYDPETGTLYARGE